MNWVSNNEAWHTSDSVSCSSSIRDLYKLQRLLRRKCHLKIDHCDQIVRFLRVFHVGHIVPNGRSVLLFAWQEWFSCNGRESKIYCCELALSSEAQMWKLHVVVWQTTAKSMPHMHYAYPLPFDKSNSLFLALLLPLQVVSLNPYCLPLCGIHEQIKWSFEFNRLLFHYFFCGSGYDGLWLDKPWDIFFVKII